MRSTKAPLLLLLVLTVIVGCKDLDRYPDAESVFHATFNSLPPQEVTGLQGMDMRLETTQPTTFGSMHPLPR